MATTNKKIIPIEVRGEYILGSGVSIGAAGSFDSTVLRVKFDDSWIGLNKYATWTNAQGIPGQEIRLSSLDLVDGEAHTYDVPVPSLPLEYAGSVKLSFTGYAITADGASIDRIMNTATGTFIVLQSNAMRLDGGNVTPTLAQQLTDTVNKCTQKIDEFEDTETLRAGAERTRDANEETRIEYEDGRKTAEDGRKTAEDERKTAEEKRQINEFGAVGNYYDEGEDVVRNSDGVKVSNAKGGRVGAEIQRRHDEADRKEKDKDRGKTVEEIKALVGDINAALASILEIQNSLIGGAG